MPRLKGTPKTGGRLPGTPNKRRQALFDLVEELYPGYDPVIAMIEIGQNSRNDIEVRLSAHKEAAQYLHTKLRSMDLALSDGDSGALRVVNIPPSASREEWIKLYGGA